MLLQQFEGVEYLLCGMGDGHLLSFVFDTVCAPDERRGAAEEYPEVI